MMHSYRVKLDFDEGAHIAAAIASGQGFSNPFGPPTGPTAWLGPCFRSCSADSLSPSVPTLQPQFSGRWSSTASVSALTCIPDLLHCPLHLRRAHRSMVGLGLGVFPYTMYWGMRHPWDTPLSAFLFALCFMATVHLAESSTLLKWAGYGLLWGIAGLCNTAELVFLPFAGCWICYRQFRQGKPFFRNAAMGAVLFFAVIAPWTIRDYRVFHKFVPHPRQFWRRVSSRQHARRHGSLAVLQASFAKHTGVAEV
jgi:hypothetical protein